MAVKIRLKRMGRRNRPFYRLVAIDGRKRRDGREIESLGWYDPLKKEDSYNLKEDRIKYWIEKGAQKSNTTNNLLTKAGLNYRWHLEKQGISEDKIKVLIEKWDEYQDVKEQNKINKKLEKKKKSLLMKIKETHT